MAGHVILSLLGMSVVLTVSTAFTVTEQESTSKASTSVKRDTRQLNATREICLAILTEDTPFGLLSWPHTEVDSLAEVECPYGPSTERWRSYGSEYNSQHGHAYARRLCSLYCTGPLWETPDYSECKEKAATITPEEAGQIAEELCTETNNASNIDSTLFVKASALLGDIFPYAVANSTVAELMLQTISNLLDTQYAVMMESDPNGTLSRRLYNLLEDYGREVDVSDWTSDHSYSFGNLNLLVSVPVTDTNDTLEFVPVFNSSGVEETLDARLRIPPEALRKAVENSSDSAVRVHMIALRNGHLLRPPGLSTSGRAHQPVITALFCPLSWSQDEEEIKITDLEDPVTIDLPFGYFGSTHFCAYFDTESKSWLRANVTTSFHGGGYRFRCESNHLTAFTLLLDAYPRKGLGSLETPMDIITDVGCWISLIGLILTIITYTVFRFGRNRWGRVLVNLCAALSCLLATSFLAALKGTLPLWACAGVAILLHVSLLAAFCWMLVEGLLLYQLLITVFQASESHFLLKRSVLAWGIPWLIVFGTAAYDFRYYGDTNPDYCMPSVSNWGLNMVVTLTPCVCILVANTVIFVQVACVLLRQRTTANSSNNNKNEQSVSWAQVRGVLGVAFLLGVTWILSPLLAVQPVLQLISTLTNSLQGAVIFVTRVWRVPESRRCWQRVLCSTRIRAGLQIRLPAQPHSTASYSLEKGSIWSRLKMNGSANAVATTAPGTCSGKWLGLGTNWAFWRGSGSVSTSGGPADWTKGSSVSYDIQI